MKTKLAVVVVTTFIMFTMGCGNKYGKLTRRYQEASDSLLVQNKIGKWVEVDAYFFQLEEPDRPKKVPKTIFDFPPSVQRKLITEYSRKDATSGELIKSISSSFKQEEKTIPDPATKYDDHTIFKKRLVVSVRNKSFYPADRIWKINVRLVKTDANTRFSNSSVISTDFETVDVGKLGYTSKSSFTTNLSAGSGVSLSDGDKNTATNSSQSTDSVSRGLRTNGTQAVSERNKGNSIENKIGGSIGYSNDLTIAEEVQLKQRYVKLSGSVNKNRISLYQESTTGIDLSGNIISDIEIRTGDVDPTNVTSRRVISFSNFMNGILYNNPGDIKAVEHVVVYPVLSGDIYGSIEFDAVVRRVKDKDKTIVEADDKVVFLHGTFSPETSSLNNILILTKREVTPRFWQISNIAGNPIRVRSLSLTEQDLYFDNMDDARSFLNWIKEKANEVETSTGRIGSYEILMGERGGNTTAVAIRALTINIVN